MYSVLATLTLLSILPFWIMILNATRSHAEILVSPVSLLPGKFLAENLARTFVLLPLWSGLLNSIIITVVSTVGNVYFGTLAAYAFHIYHFKFKEVLYAIIISFMMIPATLSLVGLFDLANKMNLLDTFKILIIPSFGVPATLFFMRQYVKITLPLDIIAQGRIDGASEIRILHNLIFPILKPGIVTISIFTFVGVWNNLLTPLVLLFTPEKFPITVLITQLNSDIRADYGLLFFTIAFAVVPIIVMYYFLAKHIVSGLTTGSLKG